MTSALRVGRAVTHPPSSGLAVLSRRRVSTNPPMRIRDGAGRRAATCYTIATVLLLPKDAG